MQVRQSRTTAALFRTLGLTLSIAACGGSDDDPAQQTNVLDAAAIGPGSMSIDAASPLGPAASPGADGATSQVAADGGGQPGAGAIDAGLGKSDAGATDASVDASSGNEAGAALERFSFFVTSLSAMRMLSGNRNGFGGDLRHGETGEGAGLRGADKICTEIAELSMPGAAAKQWRAFLSTTTVHARTRIGEGPWYDRRGRLVAQSLTALLNERPQGAAMEIRDDLPNERGEPNQAGSAEGRNDDNHDVITATDASGEYDGSNTCADWTSTTATLPGGGGPMGLGGPRIGHSWPAGSGRHWAAAHNTPGCAPSVNLVQGGGGVANGIGNLGGYGAIYCFALAP